MTRLVLDLCGGTGAWSAPYKRAGYQVEIIDITTDVRLYRSGLSLPVHGILAAPPCTMFAVSGARWKRTNGQMREALSVVDACLRIIMATKPKWWALENPVGKLVRYLGPPRFYFDPCDYGDAYTKRTALWGEFNVPRWRPVVPSAKSPIHYMAPGPERAAKRSITPAGFARAFYEANP